LSCYFRRFVRRPAIAVTGHQKQKMKAMQTIWVGRNSSYFLFTALPPYLNIIEAAEGNRIKVACIQRISRTTVPVYLWNLILNAIGKDLTINLKPFTFFNLN